jgi:hypothetical protein
MKPRPRLGLVLSLLGAALVALALVNTFVAANAMFVGILQLLAACLLIPGEQLRRGAMGANPDPPKAVLSTASVISRFRPLSLRWHALWSGLGLLFCLVILGVPALEALTQRVIPPFGFAYDLIGGWLLIGFFSLAIVAASLASLYKKAHYLKLVARGGDRLGDGAPHAGVWRFLSYRWRVDLWVAAIGGAAFSLGFIAPPLADPDVPGDVPTALAFAAVMLVVGAGIFAIALWMASNYWKAGRPLGSAESYA